MGEKKTKGFNIISYLGPAVIVGQFSLVQNSVRVPQSKFTWLKKSTAEIEKKKKKKQTNNHISDLNLMQELQ